MNQRFSRIAGTGSYLPPRRVTNQDMVADLAARGIETSDQWIVERTGIQARHFAAPDVASSDLAVHAARAALDAAGVSVSDRLTDSASGRRREHPACPGVGPAGCCAAAKTLID